MRVARGGGEEARGGERRTGTTRGESGCQCATVPERAGRYTVLSHPPLSFPLLTRAPHNKLSLERAVHAAGESPRACGVRHPSIV